MATQQIKRTDKHKNPKNSLKSVFLIGLAVLTGEIIKLALHHELNGKILFGISAAVGGIISLTLLFILIDRTIERTKNSRKPI